jgi:hypothetical protein
MTSEALNPRLTPWATLTPLDGGDGPIVMAGTDDPEDEQLMPQPDQGHDASSVGAGEQTRGKVPGQFIRFGHERSLPTIHGTAEGNRNDAPARSALTDVIAEVLSENTGSRSPSIGAPSAWDVFERRPVASVLVFQNNPTE